MRSVHHCVIDVLSEIRTDSMDKITERGKFQNYIMLTPPLPLQFARNCNIYTYRDPIPCTAMLPRRKRKVYFGLQVYS